MSGCCDVFLVSKYKNYHLINIYPSNLMQCNDEISQKSFHIWPKNPKFYHDILSWFLRVCFKLKICVAGSISFVGEKSSTTTTSSMTSTKHFEGKAEHKKSTNALLPFLSIFLLFFHFFFTLLTYKHTLQQWKRYFFRFGLGSRFVFPFLLMPFNDGRCEALSERLRIWGISCFFFAVSSEGEFLGSGKVGYFHVSIAICFYFSVSMDARSHPWKFIFLSVHIDFSRLILWA